MNVNLDKDEVGGMCDRQYVQDRYHIRHVQGIDHGRFMKLQENNKIVWSMRRKRGSE